MKKIPFLYTLVRGAIGKKFVVKHYRHGIVVTNFPAMEGIAASSKQRSCRDLFRQAVAYAKMVIANAALKAAWQQRIKKGTVYHAVLRAFMQRDILIKSLAIVTKPKVDEQPFYNFKVHLPLTSPLVFGKFFFNYSKAG